MMSQINPETYLEQFGVLGINELNCTVVSKLLYTAFLNKFKVTMTSEEYQYFREYQERVFDLVENLRELDVTIIGEIFSYIDKVNPSLVDIIIMSWSMPRIDIHLSKKIYDTTYKNNIQKYNDKIIKMIHCEPVRKFCLETLCKTNNVPVHCIDFIWLYTETLSLEFAFYNNESRTYIGVIVTDIDDCIEIGINMEYILELGLGRVMNSLCSLKQLLRRFITDEQLIKKNL